MTEDTLNNELIEEMLRDAKRVDLPSELTKNPVIHKGDDTLSTPMVVREVSSSGYVFVWDTRTFEKIPVLYYMLPKVLRRRRQDGSFRFTTHDPNKKPVHGQIKCYLHPDSPDRKHYNELGFRVCKKANITNDYQLKQHMKKKHPQEWEAIESERKERERQEDRQLQQALLRGRVIDEEEEDEDEDRELLDGEYRCSKCGKIHRETSKLGKRHLKYKEN